MDAVDTFPWRAWPRRPGGYEWFHVASRERKTDKSGDETATSFHVRAPVAFALATLAPASTGAETDLAAIKAKIAMTRRSSPLSKEDKRGRT